MYVLQQRIGYNIETGGILITNLNKKEKEITV